MEQQLVTFKELGAPVMVYAETTGSVQGQQQTPVSQRPRLPAGDFKDYGAKLTALAEYMAERGVPMAYHHHMGTIVETEAEVDLLMSNTGAGGRPARGHRPHHLCRRQSSGDDEAARQPHQPCPLQGRPPQGAQGGQGQGLELPRRRARRRLHRARRRRRSTSRPFAKLLADIRYGGWVVVEAEQDPAKANPLQMAKIGHAALTKAFSAAGFAIAA